MDVLKIYVADTEYFPSFNDIVNFKFDYWENNIIVTRETEGNVFTFLKPEGMISLRLAHPVHALRKNPGNVITSQSSAQKFQKFEFRKLGDLYVGDIVQMRGLGEVAVEGQVDKVSCQLYFQILGFHIQGKSYKVEGQYFIDSTLPQLTNRVNQDCLLKIKLRTDILDFEDIKLEDTLRYRSEQPSFCRYIYDEAAPQFKLKCWKSH